MRDRERERERKAIIDIWYSHWLPKGNMYGREKHGINYRNQNTNIKQT